MFVEGKHAKKKLRSIVVLLKIDIVFYCWITVNCIYMSTNLVFCHFELRIAFQEITMVESFQLCLQLYSF